MSKLDDLKAKGDAPDWLTEAGFHTLKGGYLIDDETPRDMYRRVANSVAKYLNKPELEDMFYEYIDNNWLCLASPVASNCGTSRGLPISCLTGDMMINTRNSVKRISDIQKGDLVLTHKGRYREVIDKQSREADDIYELVVSSRPTRIEITGNHPVKTNLGWVRVDELNPLIHLVAINNYLETSNNTYVIDSHKYLEESDTKKSNRGQFISILPTRFVEVDKDLAWALGIWFAEGSATFPRHKKPSSLRITMSKNEQQEVDRWVSIITEKFGLNGKDYHSSYFRKGKINNWISAYVSGNILANWFTQEFGRGCKEKQIPAWIIDLPSDILRSFLEGFVTGDGSHKKQTGDKRRFDKFYITLSNPFIIGGLYNICLKLGLPVSVDFSHKKSENNKYWSYSINCLEGYSLSLDSARKHRSIISGIKFEDGLIYSPIRSLIKTDRRDVVFDITVDEDHSFTVAGIVVHNCYAMSVSDSVLGIASSVVETMMLTKNGGGIGKYWGDLRQKGTPINGNGFAGSIIPWIKQSEITISSTSQGGVRRGSEANYLPIWSNEIDEFLEIRKETGDPSRRCTSSSFHHAVCINDEFMNGVKKGIAKNVDLWLKIMSIRHEDGEPYLMFEDTANRNCPIWFKDQGLKIKTSQLCNEIYLPCDDEHTFVCCLSSINLARYDEWKHTNLIEQSVWFLDGVMEEFIQKADGLPGFDRSIRFAKKSRALGLGVLGWHTLLQEKMIPFDSFEAMRLNAEIFSLIKDRADIANEELAREYGEPEWLKGYGVRNATVMAVAPTRTNALISGGVSQGIEPIDNNYYPDKTAKGTFERKNPSLERLLKEKGEDTFEVWDQITNSKGSVKHLKFLSNKEKEVFATAREINQFAIIKQAAQRQRWIDQGQSVNLFFAKPLDLDTSTRQKLGEYIHEVHFMAWELGMKGLYYLKPQSLLSGDSIYRESLECAACDG